MAVDCLIEFDSNPDGVYFAGQNLKGIITLHANKIKTTEGVVVKVLGYCHTRLKSHLGSNTNTSSKVHRGHEKYLDFQTKLLTPPPGETQLDITPGTHTFNFFCTIPPDCPSSFEKLIYGHIRYLVVLTLKCTWKFNQNFSRGFTVLKTLDIRDPLLRAPITTEEVKHYGLGPFKSGPLTMQLTLPSTGFVPGQSIPVMVLIDNQTNIDVKELVIELLLTVICRAKITVRTRNDSQAISMVKGDPVLRYSKKLFNYLLPVPPTPPSDTTNSKFINISYDLRVNAIAKGAHLTKFITTPVTIGSILTSIENFEPMTSNKSSIPVQFIEAPYMPVVPAINEGGEICFKPKYAVYDFLGTTLSNNANHNI